MMTTTMTRTTSSRPSRTAARYPWQESNLRHLFRREVLYPLSYRGARDHADPTPILPARERGERLGGNPARDDPAHEWPPDSAS
ncbi:MAG: hypothetical protein JWM86_2777 [Thermoleophilia bacterium]|nr:hypothetical protein [Thermoleophilia bacterium]